VSYNDVAIELFMKSGQEKPVSFVHNLALSLEHLFRSVCTAMLMSALCLIDHLRMFCETVLQNLENKVTSIYSKKLTNIDSS